MKKAASILIILILTVSALTSCINDSAEIPDPPEKIPDFRSADWGMSKAQVKKTELPHEEVFAEDMFMLFEVEENDENLLVFYFFEEDSLVSGECRVEMGDGKEWSVRVPEMIDYYSKFRDSISSAYGEPVNPDYRMWIDNDPDYIDDNDMTNLYHKRLEYLTEWENNCSIMSLRLYFINMDFKLVFEAFKAPIE